MSGLRHAIEACRLCEADFGFTPRPVVRGNPAARIMQISQAPSRTAHGTGLPFDDASGRTLRHDWYQIDDDTFYNEDNFYITALGHCYPGRAPHGGDRPPPKRCAQTWLEKEMDAVDNRIYILIGGHAAGYFFPREKLSSLVWRDVTLRGKPAYVLPHPSPLNVRWFKANPAYFDERLPVVRAAVKEALR